MRSADLSKREIETLKEMNAQVHYNSKYEFLRSHNGYRPSSLHMFLGISGGGKSTLARTLVNDLLKVPSETCPKVMLWLSEETYYSYMEQLSYCDGLMNLDKLIVCSEQDEEFLSLSDTDKKKYFARAVMESGTDIVIYDNITTSHFYADKSTADQLKFATYLKSCAIKRDIPIIIFGHTGGSATDFNDRILQPNDIRGSKSIVNLVEFLYVMQQIRSNQSIYSTIRVCKHRSQQVDHFLFLLIYCKDSRFYTRDKQLEFSSFKEMFKARDKL